MTVSNALAEDRPVVRGRPRVSRETGDRLLDCLHQDPARTGRMPWANVTVDEWQALFALAHTHHVDALLAFRLRSRGIDGRLPDAARQAALDARRRGARSALLAVRAGAACRLELRA